MRKRLAEKQAKKWEILKKLRERKKKKVGKVTKVLNKKDAAEKPLEPSKKEGEVAMEEG